MKRLHPSRGWIAILLSFFVHALFILPSLLSLFSWKNPEIFKENIQFGLTTLSTLPGPAAQPSPTKEMPSQGGLPAQSADAGVPVDSGLTDAGRPRRLRDAGSRDTGLEEAPLQEAGVGSVSDGGRTGVRAPFSGGYVAVRLNMDAIRGTAMADTMKRFLERNPDWTTQMSKATLDPLRDFSQIFMANSDLTRDSTIVVVKLSGSAPGPESIVTANETAFGRTPTWTPVTSTSLPDSPLQSAPYSQAEGEPVRHVTVTGLREFILSRPSDIERVIATSQAVTGHPTRLYLDGTNLVAFEAQGAKGFETIKAMVERLSLQRTDIPDSAKFEVQMLSPAEPPFDLLVNGTLTYDTETEAVSAKLHLEAFVDRAAIQVGAQPFIGPSLAAQIRAISIVQAGNKILLEKKTSLVLINTVMNLLFPERRSG